MPDEHSASREAEEALTVGKITGVHGIKGEVKILPFEGMQWLDLKTVFLMDASGKRPESLAIRHIRRQKGFFIALMEGCGTREDALTLTGMRVCIRKKDLPPLPEGEYYLHELIGMEVRTDDGRPLGRVTDVFSTGANDVIEVEGPSGTVLIPAISGTVKEVSAVGRRITVHLMEGLEERPDAVRTAKRRED